MKRCIPLLLMMAIICGHFHAVKSAMAKDAIVYAVLFYSPTCSHCAKLDKEVMPSLQQKYGNKLVIFRLNVVSAAGNSIYEKALERFKITENRIGVPTIIIGEEFLVGTVEIPEKFPDLINAALSKGGIDLPNLPGLYQEFVAQSNLRLENLSTWQFMAYKFKQDPLANSISVIILLIMLTSVIAALLITLSSVKVPKVLTILPDWIIPFLAVIGLVIALYLSYIEVSETRAVCGPVGNCNAVQNSPYAKLFGILPIPVMGMVGYIAILTVWFSGKFGPEPLKRLARLALWGLGIFSVLFSSYLTFLEPFVIGATCSFCLISAIVTTIILWVSILPARKVLRKHRNGC
ncbi:MAG: vitamin K epoxide reductase family protein [Smithellaceae bacterium]